MNVWKAALYIRLSVEFNGKKGDSLETQRDIMEAHLALHPDIEIVESYVDNGVSGQTFQRPSFQRMLEDIEAGKITCVVVKDLSRLGRSAIDSGYYIERYFPLHHVRFIAVNDQFDSEDSENGGNHVIVPLKNMINEAYAADISRKVRSQQRQAMQEGQFVGSRPPYGYKKDPQDCHKLLVNEDTAPVVRQIFQWVCDEVPINRIAKLLNETGIPSPGHYQASIGLITNEKLIGSGVWQSRTLAKILSDEVYTGDMVQGKTKNVRRKQQPTSPEEWVRIPNTHEAVISREMFAKAQSNLSKSTRTSENRTPYTENILRGKIFCGCCGHHMNRHRDSKTGVYGFDCIANERIKAGACPNRPHIAEISLFQTILTITRKEAETILGNRLLLEQKDDRIAKRQAETEREITRLQGEVDKNRKFMSSLYENFARGILTSAEYMEMKAGYESKITQGTTEIQRLRTRKNSLETQIGEYRTLADELEKVGQDTKLTAQMADRLIERITVYSADNIKIDFRFQTGFDRVKEVLADE